MPDSDINTTLMTEKDHPLTSRSTVSKVYKSGEYWHGIHDYLSDQAPNKIAWLLQLIDFQDLLRSLQFKRLSIVDIGCGAGKVSTGLAKRLRERYLNVKISVDGYDLSPQAIEVAQRENAEGNFVCGDFKDGGQIWDLALLCDVIEHVEDPPAFLSSVAECSRFFVVGFAMDDNMSYRLSKRRQEIMRRDSHISIFNEKRATAAVDKVGMIQASGYIPNPLARNFHIRSTRSIITLPFRVIIQLLSRRLKGKIFGGESLYFFCRSRLLTDD